MLPAFVELTMPNETRSGCHSLTRSGGASGCNTFRRSRKSRAWLRRAWRSRRGLHTGFAQQLLPTPAVVMRVMTSGTFHLAVEKGQAGTLVEIEGRGSYPVIPQWLCQSRAGIMRSVAYNANFTLCPALGGKIIGATPNPGIGGRSTQEKHQDCPPDQDGRRVFHACQTSG